MERRAFMKAAGFGALGLALGPKAISAEEPSPRIRWGLVGTGKRCRQHVKVLQRMPEYRIVALCDIQKDRLDQTMEVCKADSPVLSGVEGPTGYADYHDLLKRDDLDVILIATPNYVHREVVVAALKSGRHVLTEKPMGITVEECNDMIGTAKGSGKILQVGLQLRYAPFYQKVHSLLREGIIGKPKFVWFNEFRGDWAKQSADPEVDDKINWRFYQKLSGGTLLEKSCHYFDLFRWMIGTEPLRVCAMGGVNFYTNGRETLDHASVVIEFEGDCKATHGLSMYSPHGRGFFIIGEKGALDLNWETGDIVLKHQGKKDEILKADVSNQDTGGHIGTGEMHASFLDCMRTGKPPLTDPVAGKESIRLGLAAEKSVKEHRWVEMSEIPA